jgi:protein tyrosine phosphatase
VIPISQYKNSEVLIHLTQRSSLATPDQPQRNVAEDEFDELNHSTSPIPETSFGTAMMEENLMKNRYRNIIPPDYTRVVLHGK